MNYIKSIKTVTELPALSPTLVKEIEENANALRRVLERTHRKAFIHGLGRTEEQLRVSEPEIVDFEDSISRYNPALSEDDIKAWVWYKRRSGVPMTGWEKYFIADSEAPGSAGVKGDLVYTTTMTTYKDANHVAIGKFMEGALVGVYSGKKMTDNHNVELLIVFSDAYKGFVFVPASDVRFEKSFVTQSGNELERLVKEGYLFYYDGELLPLSIYLYANNYDRELQLRSDKEDIVKLYGEETYSRQEAELLKARPQQLSFFSDEPSMRPQVSPLSSFANGEIMINELDDAETSLYGHECTLRDAFSSWLYAHAHDVALFDVSSAIDIVNYYLHGKNYVIKDKGTMSPDELKKAEEQKNKVLSDARLQGDKLFSHFLHSIITSEDRLKADMLWNRMYNGFPLSIRYDKVPIAFAHNRFFNGQELEIRPIQREGIAFMEMKESGIVSFDVGVGKTITAIVAIANALQEGRCRRPLVVVPNSTYANWIKELFGKKGVGGVLSGTGVGLNDWYNLSSDVVDENELTLRVRENSITVVTYEGFNKIGFRQETAKTLVTELIEILDPDDEGSDRSQSQKIQKIIDKIQIGNKEAICAIEDLGFDFVVLDEAHNFKNSFASVPVIKDKETGAKQRGFSGGAESMRSLHAFFINVYLQKQQAGRNVMLLTATPFTNRPTEMYSMVAHVALRELAEHGYKDIRYFMQQFAQWEQQEVVTAGQETALKDVITGVKNKLVLQSILFNRILYRTADEAGIKRPTKVNIPLLYKKTSENHSELLSTDKQIVSYLQPTERQAKNQAQINQMFNGAARNANSSDAFRAMNASLDNALHPALYDHVEPTGYIEAVEASPKFEYVCRCIISVKNWHENHGQKPSGQVIFSNRGKTLFPYLKDYLINVGRFKRDVTFEYEGRGKKRKATFDEVEVIEGGVSADKKDLIMQAFNAGVILVLIGTATIREGVNLQKRGTCLYDIYPEWNPTDMQQLEGRIWRQGNRYQFVRVVLPLVQNSMDTFVFQKLQEKTSRINDIWSTSSRSNVLPAESLDPKQIKAALITDVDKIVRQQLQDEKDRLNREDTIARQAKEKLQEAKRDYDNLVFYRERADQEFTNKLNAMKESEFRLRPTDEQIKERIEDAEERKKIKQRWAFFDKYTELYNITPRTDDVRTKLYQMSGMWHDSFKDAKKRFACIVRDFFNGNDDETDIKQKFDDLIAAQDVKIGKIAVEAAKVTTSEHYAQLTGQVNEMKRKLNIDGGTPEKREKEFESLNYLLSYPFDRNKQFLALPAHEYKSETPIEVEKDTKSIDERERKRKLVKIKLKLALAIKE